MLILAVLNQSAQQHVTSASFWLILAPYLTLLVAILGLGAAFYPQWRAHRNGQQLRERREERIDATCDAVLGCDADYNIGKSAQRGLVKAVQAIERAVGPLNGTGKNLVQLNEEGVHITTKLSEKLDAQARKLDDHIAADQQEFNRVWAKVNDK